MNGAAKCNICGRFRRWVDVVSVDYSDEFTIAVVAECITCTAPSNLSEVAA